MLSRFSQAKIEFEGDRCVGCDAPHRRGLTVGPRVGRDPVSAPGPLVFLRRRSRIPAHALRETGLDPLDLSRSPADQEAATTRDGVPLVAVGHASVIRHVECSPLFLHGPHAV